MTEANTAVTLIAAPDLKALGLSDSDLPEIARVAEAIKANDILTVHKFGRDVSDHTSSYADDLLDQVRNSDLDDAGAKLTEVVSVARSMNLHALSDNRSRIPVIGRLIDRIKGGSNKFMAEFESTRTQIERLVAEVNETQAGLADRNRALEDLFQSIRAEHRMLGVHIAAGKSRLAELRASAEEMRSNIGNDPAKVQEISDLDALIANLDKRVGDLVVLQQSAMLSLPTIRLIQTNNQLLVDKYHTIQEITLPTWKNQFLLRLSLNEQRNAVKLANEIDDTTNALLVKNAQLLHQNSVETAKANQRLVIDVDSLRIAHNSLIQTVEDVMRIQREGSAIRMQAEKEVQGMRVNLESKLTQTDARKRLH
ncbi:toxic anion resistance protein [Pseudomonas aeruginosa]|nr:toxic anion resistance protein [Pseudomonas aeruginosa]EKX2969300.1 toxic anion resistance protein [Pseudomonas aeruginosa]